MTHWKVRYSPLPEQFADVDEVMKEIREHLVTCQFTLGPPVQQFERSFADVIGTRHAIGVGSGTDAIMLALKAAGVQPGDEVITAANTFIATVGAIHAAGARPVLVDVTPSYNIDPRLIEAAITPRTRALVPVHYAGEPAEMAPIMAIAARHGLPIVEDACHAIQAHEHGRRAGTFGVAGCFSLHPLKNLNVWGDGGVITTDSDEIAGTLRLLRNHGLRSRDEVEILGHNSRLDSIQAIVGNWLIRQMDDITATRIRYAAMYDRAFAAIADSVTIPVRRPDVKSVYHLYMVTAERRDELYRYLHAQGVEAKIHYPIPLHLQPALARFGYARGDFPVTERLAGRLISLPLDQHLTEDAVAYCAQTVLDFYRR